MMQKYRLYSLTFFILFISLTLFVIIGLTKGFDQTVLDNTYNLREYWWKPINLLGGTYFLLSASLLTVFFLLLKKKVTNALLFSSNLCIAFLCYQAIKEIVARPRPEMAHSIERTLAIFSTYSFPSGHTVGAIAFFVGFCIFVLEKNWTLKNILPYLSISSFVGLSVVITGRHYLTDVIGGIFLSLLIIVLLLEIDRVFDVNIYTQKALEYIEDWF